MAELQGVVRFMVCNQCSRGRDFRLRMETAVAVICSWREIISLKRVNLFEMLHL